MAQNTDLKIENNGNNTHNIFLQFQIIGRNHIKLATVAAIVVTIIARSLAVLVSGEPGRLDS